MNNEILPEQGDQASHYLLAGASQPSVAACRFPKTLERQFRRLHAARHKSRARFWQLYLLATGLIFGVSRLHHGALGSAASVFEIVLRFGVILPAWAVLAGLAWSSRYEKLYPRVARFLVPVTGCLLAVLMTELMVAGRGEALSGLTTHMLGLLFLSGLLFRQALWACAAMLLTFMGVALYEGMGLTKLLFDSISPIATLGVGGFVYYEIEKASRRAFLDHAQAAEQADRDGLTGLKNRRAFDEHLRRIWQQALRDKRGIGLLLLDVDEFKLYNDHYGHQAGDGALQKIAAVTQHIPQRSLDLAARFGGEEFAVILYDVTRDHLHKMAERLRASVQELALEHRSSTVAEVVTVSIGTAYVHVEPERRCEGLIQLADEALYEAKRAGRNGFNLKEEEYRSLTTGIFRNPAICNRTAGAA